jgi:transcriptional regulator with XRE-family HTH domain
MNAHEAAVCANVRAWAGSLGYSQQQLADYLNVTRSLVGAWYEKRSCPRLTQLVAICRLFGRTLDELIAHPEPPGSPGSGR